MFCLFVLCLGGYFSNNFKKKKKKKHGSLIYLDLKKGVIAWKWEEGRVGGGGFPLPPKYPPF